MYYDDDVADLLVPPAEEWKPLYWTPMKSKLTLGDDICDFIENFLTPPRLTKSEWKVEPWQRWLLRHMFELNSFGLFRYRKVFWGIPRKNGKSFIASAILAYFLIKGREGDQLFCAAASSKQARVVFDEVTKNIRNSSVLSKIAQPMKDRVNSRITNAFISVLPFSAGGNHGLGSYITVGDELHAWDGISGETSRGRDFFGALTTGSNDRDESMFIGITTAGSNLKGVAYEQYEIGLSVATGETDDDSFGFFWWGADEKDPIDEPETWRKANPNITAGLMKEERISEDFGQALLTGTSDFERYYLNKWVEHSANEKFLQPSYIHAATEGHDLQSFKRGEKITLGFDGSATNDSTVFVGYSLDTGLMQTLWAKEKKDHADDFFVSEDEVLEAMEHIQATYDVTLAYCDQSHYLSTVEKWRRKYKNSRGRSNVRDLPQSPKRMLEVSTEFRKAFYSGEIKLAKSDSVILNHFGNAVENLYGKPKKEKRKSTNKIDALDAGMLAYWAATEVQEANRRQVERNRATGHQDNFALPF